MDKEHVRGLLARMGFVDNVELIKRNSLSLTLKNFIFQFMSGDSLNRVRYDIYTKEGISPGSYYEGFAIIEQFPKMNKSEKERYFLYLYRVSSLKREVIEENLSNENTLNPKSYFESRRGLFWKRDF